MSAPQPPEASVEAGARAAFRSEMSAHADSWESLYESTRELWRDSADVVLTAALPHLHRDWLEGLIAKAKGEYEAADDCWRKADPGSEEEMVSGIASDYAETVIGWLRAELAKGGDGE